MFFFCICPDGTLLKERISALLRERGDAWERQVYWGDEELPSAFWEHLALPGLFAARRVLVLRRAEALSAAVWKRVSAALAAPKEHCLPVLCLESAWEKGQPKIPAHIAKLKCLAHADAQGWVWRSPGLDERALRPFIVKEAKARNLNLAQPALDILCSGLIPDAGAVRAELDRLALAAPEGEVSEELAAQAAQMPRFNIFQFLRMVQGGRAEQAWTELLCARKENEGLLFPFLGLLSREARLLWQLARGEPARMHPGDAEAKRVLAQRLGHKGLARLFSLIFAADLAVKSGGCTPDQALDALVADLTLLLGARPPEAAP